MKKYETEVGEHITEVARNMIALAEKTQEVVIADFNGITVVAKPGDKEQELTDYFNNQVARRRKEYENSPEGRRAAQETEERKQEMQRKYETLLQHLPNLDFKSDEAVLSWLCEFQNPSDYIGLKKDPKKVLEIFISHGYKPNANTGEVFNKDDRDNFARYIIGQALAGLECEVGAIHQVIHSFVGDWKTKFLSVKA